MFNSQTALPGFMGPSAKGTNSIPLSSFWIVKSSTLISWCSWRPLRPKCMLVNSHHMVFIRERGLFWPSWPNSQRICSSCAVRLFALLGRGAFPFLNAVVFVLFFPAPFLNSGTLHLLIYIWDSFSLSNAVPMLPASLLGSLARRRCHCHGEFQHKITT